MASNTDQQVAHLLQYTGHMLVLVVMLYGAAIKLDTLSPAGHAGEYRSVEKVHQNEIGKLHETRTHTHTAKYSRQKLQSSS